MNGRSFGLDLLRALAITLVLIAHFAKEIEHFGFWGVELFFALSGFLIGQILWNSFREDGVWEVNKLTNFWKRRWWRTLPNYYFFLIIMLLFNWYRNMPIPPFQMLQKYFWFGQNLFERNSGFFGISWSLCIEEWFYLTFPFVLFLIGYIIKNKHISFITTFLIIVVGSFIVRANILSLSEGYSALRGITFARLDSIACGVFIAYLYLNVAPENVAKFRIGTFFIGFVLLVYSFIKVYFANTSYLDIKQDSVLLFIVPCSFALMLPYISLLNKFKYAFFNQVIERGSLWSYSLYLSHIPVLFLVYDFTSGMRDTTLGNLTSKCIGLVITVVVSAITYKYIEIPFINKRPKAI